MGWLFEPSTTPPIGAATQTLNTLPGIAVDRLTLPALAYAVTYPTAMPVNTNLAFREFGIALFFAAVGLGAGAKFFATVFSATGLQWLLAGACVTVVPLMLIGIFARAVLKMNFMDLSGLLAGSMTDPPALAFASNIAGSDAPTVAYATVYPLTTLLRILSAQVLAIVLFR